MTNDQTHQWDYNGCGQHGPDDWGWDCQTGNQSPIDILHHHTTFTNERTLTGVNYPVLPQVSLVNTGFSIMISYPEDYQGTATGAGHTYQAVQSHFHCPGEHQFEGFTYPLCMHMVQTRNVGNEIHYLVLEILFTDQGEIDQAADHELGKIMGALPSNPAKFQQDDAPIPVANFNPSVFVDIKNEVHYSYNGSLTTPPCSVPVKWFVFVEPKVISSENLKRIESYYHANARPGQCFGDCMRRDLKLHVPANKPVDVALLLETSDNLAGLDQLQTEASNFTTIAKEISGHLESRFGIISFADTAHQQLAFTDLKDDSEIQNKIKSLTSGGGTNLSLAIQQGYEMLSNSNHAHQREMVLFSTGYHRQLSPSPELLEDHYFRFPIHTICFGEDEAHKAQMRMISERSGGTFYQAGSETALKEIFSEIIDGTEVTQVVANVPEIFKDQCGHQSAVAHVPENTPEAIFVTTWDDHSVQYTKRAPAWEQGQLQIELTDPNGEAVQPQDVQHHGGFAMVKVSSPAAGTWKIATNYSDRGEKPNLEVSFSSFISKA